MLPVKVIKECFIYIPETGLLVWRERPRSHFLCEAGYKSFNIKFPYKVAGSLDN